MNINRRDFLKLMGCAGAAAVLCGVRGATTESVEPEQPTALNDGADFRPAFAMVQGYPEFRVRLRYAPNGSVLSEFSIDRDPRNIKPGDFVNVTWKDNTMRLFVTKTIWNGNGCGELLLSDYSGLFRRMQI